MSGQTTPASVLAVRGDAGGDGADDVDEDDRDRASPGRRRLTPARTHSGTDAPTTDDAEAVAAPAAAAAIDVLGPLVDDDVDAVATRAPRRRGRLVAAVLVLLPLPLPLPLLLLLLRPLAP